ncbi:MAG: beta-glucosidase [Sphingobacteriaceae bacterium]|nr:MAG: beta-glucosidase [Sphingobacteriaceae bacterium]
MPVKKASSKTIVTAVLLVHTVFITLFSLSVSAQNQKKLTDNQLLDTVQKRTFQYFWQGAEPVSGMAYERVHMDNIYPNHDSTTIATGASGFGMMAILVGIERRFITRKQGTERFEKIVSFLEKADRYHGAYSHWMLPNGKIKAFGKTDNGGDLVETSFLMQGLLCVRQYYATGDLQEKKLSKRIDELWKAVDYNWYRQNNHNVLYWHWSPQYAWIENFPVTGYNECLILYVLGGSSPMHGVPAAVYQDGWARSGEIETNIKPYGYLITLKHNVAVGDNVGPLFWSHYSYLGLNPKGLKDKYADYWLHNTNHTLINRAYCLQNPKNYKGYGENCWGLTASYSINGYAAHNSNLKDDLGVIAPTAAISSYPYTPKESMKVIRHLYEDLGDKVWGRYGFYDAFSETKNWFPHKYLGIDQGPQVVMLENARSGLLWNLFMSCPEVRTGLTKLGFTYPKPKLK